MRWTLSHKFDPRAKVLADRHYNRRKPESPQFVPPGRSLVLLSVDESAFWVTSWPFARYVRHAWPGAWVCSAFRNEGAGLSSELIREAVAASRWRWPDVPELGMVTFVNAAKVRRKRDPGRCYLRAGFENVGETAGGWSRCNCFPIGCRMRSSRSMVRTRCWRRWKMGEKRARKVAARAARKAGGKRALRKLRERDQLEQRRAAAHGIGPWVGPERERRAGRLVRGVREAMARAGTVTRRDVDLEREGRLVVAPDPTRERAINEALRRREGGSDAGE